MSKVAPKEQEPDDGTIEIGGVAGKRILAFVQRIETLEQEKSDISEDIKEIYGEAKATGLDAKTIRKLVRVRKMDREKYNEQLELFNLYSSAIGME